MAKSSKSARTDRQKVVEQMRAQQKAAERRRGTIIVAACVLVAVGIVAAAATGPILDHFRTSKFSGKPLTDIGAPASVCQPVTTKPADGNQQHLADGSPVSYPDSPPAFGKHYITPDAMARKFYTAQDRPALGTLVHNEEHGYTILWYDDTVAKDSTKMAQIKAIADKFAGTSDLRDKFKAVPWTSSDGSRLPERPAHRVHALVGRRHPERSTGLGEAGRRLAVLLQRLGRRAPDLHGRLPVQRLPRAQRGVVRSGLRDRSRGAGPPSP